MIVAAIVWLWCVLAVVACVLCGRFKDHPSNKDPNDRS
jgi:hypothetical protein